MTADKKEEKEFDPEEDLDPKTLKAVDLQSNLFGQNKAFERLVNLDCNEIKKVAHENVFTLNTINDILGENINFNKAKKLGFVATDEAKIRVATILLAARSRIFLLITGSTSSAKTFSVLVASHIYENNVYNEGVESKEQIKLLRKNLSEDSTRDDLIGSIIYDDKKDRFIFKQGDFTEAFEKGYWLLLDELSLAPPSVLQAIEAALDSNRLTVQEIGSTREINMHKNFFLVCTTNPNNEEYSRFNLSQEFLDRFHCITFNNLSNNEMKNIILKKCQRIDIDHEIQQIVNAHIKYTGEQGPKCKNMYTLRELDKACLLLDKGYKAEKIIDILYRTRAGEDMKTYTSSDNPFRNHQNFISTSNRNKYGKLALDCLENGFNIILESENSEGTSYFAEAIATQFNSRTSPLIISMTNELHVSDLTHFSVPVVNDADGNTEMKIQVLNGVIYKAMKEGRVVIINDLERGNTRVIESLNDIYESNVLEESTMNFQRDIEINPNFRIIFTFHSNVQHKLSAAFFNRFIHIKIIGTGEISRSFKTEKGMPINIYHNSVFPSSANVKNEVENLCQKKNIAHTSQIETVYSLTMASIKSKIPICILGVSGYGRTLGIDLMLKKENEESRIHYIYCTSETSIDTLIGKFVFEGRLLFQEGPLLQAATKGEIIIFKNIDKLSYHAFSCIESILCCLKNKGRELVIPGIDVSKYTLSQNFCCLATIDGDTKKEIPYHISKYFKICTFTSPTKEDYEKICQLDHILFNDRRQLIDSLVSCFLSCYESKDIFDTSYRMLKRILSSIERLCPPVSPIYQAISLFALFQNINENNKVSLIANLGEKLKFNASEAEKLIDSDVVIKDKQLVKGQLSCSLASFEDLDKIKALSKEQLNVAFYIISCHSPINIIGPTSFKETIIKTLKQNRVKVFNATSETTIGDIIGSISFKKNNPLSGKFGHGDIYDLLIDYMTTNFSTHSKIIALNLNLPESFANVEKIINDMDEGKLKPYFQYLLNIVKQESEYATFFELGYIIRELLLDNIVLLKNVDQCSQNIIDSLIPFLNDTIDLNQYIPGIVYHQTSSLFFTCSEQGFNKLPSNFKSRVQNVQIRYLGKDDIKSCVEDFHLLEAYDFHIHDYSDIMRAINIIKVAGVLNKFNTSEERIRVSQNIFEMKSEHSTGYDLFNINDNNKIYELDELLQYDDASQMLHAKRTGVMIKVPNYNDIPLKTIVYIPSVAYLLDLAIISLATHIPLIVESSPGQTKSTLVRLLGEAFGKQTVVTNMSKNRTSEEFIGQLIPTDKGFSYEIGDLYKYIDRDIFYLIDEINLASPSLLSQFLSIFKAPYDSDVAHPREPGPFLKKFDLFATMNPATLTAGRTYLPPGFSSCSITYKMPNYSKWDNAVIFTNILCQFRDNLEDFEESSKFIVECHKDSLDQSNDVTIRDMLKLAEAFKSCLLKDPRISKNTIASLIQLIYSSKMINKDEFDEKVDKFRGVINKKAASKKMTKSQFRLIEQMKDALSMNRGIIIRGPSGCGKTHCIKCLANGDFDGHEHKLYTIQLCAESDISELFGRFEPYYLDNDKALRKLKQSILIQLGDESINEEISNKLASYLGQLSDKESTHKIVELMKLDPIITELPMIEKKINKYLDKSKRSLQFVYRNSPLIDAMENGDWIVLDNINLCPGDILESLNSLLEESHSLRISKGKHDTVYAMSLNENIENGKQIHQDFRLIMTSDDRVLDTSHILPAPFLSRCIVLKIGTPENQDLSNISRNYFDVPIYSDFLCKCFVNQPKNHVRDIIRMIKLCKFLNLNQRIFKREYELGKTIKFILENNYLIPDSFIIPKSDNDDIIKETLSIIQTNLMNNTLMDQDFHPLNLDEMKRSLQQLNQSEILNDLKQLFKETLRLCCYIYSSKSFYPNTRNNEIQNKLITFLLCGYLVSCDPTKLIPETIWNLKFMPAIWDFLFITKDNYGDFSTKNGFIEFLNSHYMESDEFAIEFYNYANKNTRGYKNNKDQYLEIINNLFSRRYGPDHIEFFKNQDKSRIIIQYLPIQFPSIPNYKLIQNDITYDKLIEIFNWLNISHPYNNKIMLSFNFSIEQYAISSEFQFIYNNTYDLDVATIYSEILKYDDEYRLLKKISEMAENSNDLYGTISKIIKPYNMTIDSLSNCRKEINEKYNKHTELTDLIIDILNKAANIISRAYEQKRELEELNQNQQRIYTNILNLRLTIKNAFIKSEIDHLLKTENVNDELWNKIQDLSLFDKRIIENKPGQYRKIQSSYIRYNPNMSIKDCENIEYSVITTNFIVPSFCKNI